MGVCYTFQPSNVDSGAVVCIFLWIFTQSYHICTLCKAIFPGPPAASFSWCFVFFQFHYLTPNDHCKFKNSLFDSFLSACGYQLLLKAIEVKLSNFYNYRPILKIKSAVFSQQNFCVILRETIYSFI